MLVTEALALGLQLFKGIKSAVEAGKQEVSEEDIDAALAEVQASDDRLSDAIRRAREREA